MGSFPIQSYPSNTNEWIEDGISGIGVPPEDPEAVERAIRKVILDDNLVDSAAQINWKVAQSRLEAKNVGLQAKEMYKNILNTEE